LQSKGEHQGWKNGMEVQWRSCRPECAALFTPLNCQF